MSSSSDADAGGPSVERVKQMMRRIRRDKQHLKTDDDLKKMADQCTDMLMGMMDSKKKNVSFSCDKEKTVTPRNQDPLGMSLRDYMGANKERPDFEKIFNEKLKELKRHNEEQKKKDNFFKDASSSDSLKSSDVSDEDSNGPQSSGSELEKQVMEMYEKNSALKGAGDASFLIGKDYDKIREKAMDWLKKHDTFADTNLRIGDDSTDEENAGDLVPTKLGPEVKKLTRKATKAPSASTASAKAFPRQGYSGMKKSEPESIGKKSARKPIKKL